MQSSLQSHLADLRVERSQRSLHQSHHRRHDASHFEPVEPLREPPNASVPLGNATSFLQDITSPIAGSSSCSRFPTFSSIQNRSFRSQQRHKYPTDALPSTARSSSSRLFGFCGSEDTAKRRRLPGEPRSARRTSEATKTDCVCTGKPVISTADDGNELTSRSA